ncbi:hypothetical protein RHMOL_Rhmol01G0074000 [Rhododendron molle]|uniref:Uncharacterized protein n=1 Tax=Rhododendron molle TaxID=49168 RepID=A0ACC0PYV8_RHOML|nr:hypothetical protein RHMOL_Rhmol01G0074000 [Rhododendron molle]
MLAITIEGFSTHQIGALTGQIVLQTELRGSMVEVFKALAMVFSKSKFCSSVILFSSFLLLNSEFDKIFPK